MNRKFTSILAVIGLGVGSLAAASPALADAFGTMPSGCSMSVPAPYIGNSSTKTIYYQASGYCSLANSMDIRLVHNYDGVPDIRVKQITSYGGPSFSGAGSTCDNGGSTQYYDEGAFHYSSRGDTQRVSGTVTLSHC